jgi:hypothetical protein
VSPQSLDAAEAIGLTLAGLARANVTARIELSVLANRCTM